MMFLFVGATLGVLAYLNMKASPSYGEGFLPVGAKHEARERDYFFALAFVLWGMWAGSGAVRLFVRAGRRWRFVGLAVASLPFLLNFRAVDRSSPPDATAARDSAIRILRNAPERAVVFAYGDNDTYPVWYLQHVEGVRTDVTLITVPLLGAEWYRAELLRRNALLDLGFVENWRGVGETMKGICIEAHSLGRSIVAKPVRDRFALPTECTL
jgi:hypothetical protein